MIATTYLRTSRMISDWPVVEQPDQSFAVYVAFEGRLHRAPVSDERFIDAVNGIARRCWVD